MYINSVDECECTEQEHFPWLFKSTEKSIVRASSSPNQGLLETGAYLSSTITTETHITQVILFPTWYT